MLIWVESLLLSGITLVILLIRQMLCRLLKRCRLWLVWIDVGLVLWLCMHDWRLLLGLHVLMLKIGCWRLCDIGRIMIGCMLCMLAEWDL